MFLYNIVNNKLKHNKMETKTYCIYCNNCSNDGIEVTLKEMTEEQRELFEEIINDLSLDYSAELHIYTVEEFEEYVGFEELNEEQVEMFREYGIEI